MCFQLARYTKEGYLHLGTLGSTILLPDTRCLVDNKKSKLPQLMDCDKVKSTLHKRWSFIQVNSYFFVAINCLLEKIIVVNDIITCFSLTFFVIHVVNLDFIYKYTIPIPSTSSTHPLFFFNYFLEVPVGHIYHWNTNFA